MPFIPQYEGEVPTLGWIVLDWMSAMLATPDKSEYQPFTPTPEQAQFVLNFYRVDETTGRRKYRRGVISRPKGWGKSPLLSALCAVEGLGPVVPDGFDANGRPVGRPWSWTRTPLVQLAAVSEDQTANAYAPLLEMLREGPVIDEYPGLEPMEGFTLLPRGRIEPVTASATSREGGRPIFCVLDQTESWTPTNGGVRLAGVLRRNLGKTGGSSIEAPNSYVPGLESVSEESFKFYTLIKEGKARDDGLYVDHKESPADTDMSDRDSLIDGLAHAYGDAADRAGGWVDLDRLVAEIWDPSTRVEDARQYYLNQITQATDSWLSALDLKGIADRAKVVEEKEAITLGFDGSRKRSRGVADSTALVACRVSDGHLFLLDCWEQPEGPEGKNWEVPKLQVHAAVHDAMKKYNVIAFFADPAMWESDISEWESQYGKKLKVKSSAAHPIEWWITAGRVTTMVRAIERLENAITDREITYDGTSVLTKHFLNARRRRSTRGMQINKAYPDSPNKIDAAIAAILAYEARAHALAQGFTGRKKSKRIVRM
ncbi:terminase [Streptomyces malaysiensis]